ncbi:glycosyltransferase family 4 protein [Methylomonas albis]|uniref:Glycosyltransferase family 4 protein n=1 Tax=Methylomonas albis TaxID=1854563 RepID=A0ABR9CZD2_9GAMM|nr:glycosyltransferase family 1 protein [Methylomonas albis]MBD9356065.1 glycosyltransferase family 4 protein [Methylomonas albis]
MTIYIDCTDFFRGDGNTGIRRTERNVIINMLSICTDRAIPCQMAYYDPFYGFIIAADSSKGISYFTSISLATRQFLRLKNLFKKVFLFLSPTFIDRVWGEYTRLLILPIFLPASIPIILIANLVTHLSPKNIWKPSSKDILFIPGSSWWSAFYSNAVAETKNNNAKIVTIIYDLIPITHRNFVTKVHEKNFSSKIDFALASSDLILSISHDTAKVIEQYISDHPDIHKKDIVAFKLGADLDLISDSLKTREYLHKLFEKNTVYISVGTIEPRKNYNFLLDAFECIWQTHPDLKLCIIGKYGWESDATIARIKSHPMFGSSLIWFQDLSDNELSFCYKNAKALIFPSMTEGFGLPLVEALSFKCPVLASDIPVFHEIGGNYCSYFSLTNKDELVSLIHKSSQVVSCENTENFSWPTWKECTAEILNIIETNVINSNLVK